MTAVHANSFVHTKVLYCKLW